MLRSLYEQGPRYTGSSPKPHRPHAQPAARSLAILVLVSLLALVVPTGDPAADAAVGQADERARREEVRRERATAATQLDALRANDAELEAAVATLQANVDAQQARVDDARRAVADAQAEVERLHAELATTEQRVDDLQELVRERAVRSYIDPANGRNATDLVLNAEDPSDLERRKALLAAVNGNDRNALDQLAQARQELQRQREDAAAAEAEAEALQAEAEGRLTELEAARNERARMQAALEARISAFRSEVDALAAEEENLTAIISEAEARARAAEEARRAEAARQAAAARSTTTTAGSGSGGSGSSGSSTPAPSAPEQVDRPVGGGGLVWPAAGPVTSGFGPRWGRMHHGIDISAPTGTPIYSAAAGTVIFVGVQGGYGNLVLVDHGNGMITAYAHMSRFGTSNGASVGAGQLIGYVGSTGNSTGPHLHFETRVGGSPRDPMNYL